MSLRNGVLSSRTMAVWSLAAVFLLGTGSLSLQAQEYTPLPGLRVSDGRVHYLFFSAGGCINLNSIINGVLYTTHTSKWQRREGATWVDVPGTERDGVCAYSTTSPGEYRLVAEISIGGERGFYSSENTFTIEGMTPPPVTGGPTYYFPQLAVGGVWQTTITYINYSSEEVTCQTEFLADDGTPLMVSFADRGTVPSRTDVLQPGGSIHQETNVALSAPQGGWARATCSGPVKASLLYRRFEGGVPTGEAGVNATTVPATRFITFAEQGEGKPGTAVAYANPSDTTTAFVTFTVRNADGEVLASDDLMLSPNGHGAQNMVDLFDLTSFSGSLEITSTEPIVSLSLNAEAAPVFSSLPPGELDTAAQGATTYYFPQLAVGGVWQTTITYINYSPQEVTCQTDFISDDGSPLLVSFAGLGTVVSRTDPLPPGGSVHQETNVALSAPQGGWARATCSGPVKASLLYRRFEGGVPTGEAGVNATTVPATRFITFAEQGEGKPGTAVAYANPSDTSALVTFTAKDVDGETVASVAKTLLSNGHGAQNMVDLFDLTSFSGSLEITSTEPIVTLSINAEAAPVFSSLPPGEVDAADIPGEMLAPADEAAFNELFVGKRAATNFPTVYADFVSPGRFRETQGAETYTGSYTYQNTGSNTGTVTFNYDDGDRCTASLTFDSTTSGTATSMCDDGSRVEYDWRLVEIPGSGGGGDVSIPQSPSVTTRVSPSQLIVGERAEFILNWNEVAGATSYEVRVSQFVPIFFTRHPDGSCTVPSSVTTHETSYTYRFTASFQNQLYYTVQACNSAGCSCPPG